MSVLEHACNRKSGVIGIVVMVALALGGSHAGSVETSAVVLGEHPMLGPITQTTSPADVSLVRPIQPFPAGVERADTNYLAPILSRNAMDRAALGEPAGKREPFDLPTFRAPEGLLWVKWRELETGISQDARVITDCRADINQCASPAALRLLEIVDQARHMPIRLAIPIINRTINLSIAYVSDVTQHGLPDVWSSPLATLTTEQGDCEDYAIVKYEALRRLGLPEDDLRLLLVRDSSMGQDHAVLGVRYGGRWLILDNRHSYVLEAAALNQFVPLIAIDHVGVKLFAGASRAILSQDPTAMASAAPSGHWSE
jgi:predicted transglutaminase-like cysteine proteinase